MDSCDVLIVGGGPAGSSCAWGLRASGLRVAVLDKARFPRDKVCGGWITPQVLEALEIDAKDYARRRTLQPIHGFRVSSIASREVEIAYPRAVSYGIRRSEFDTYLLRRSGAQVCEGVSVNSVERSTDGWIVNGKIHARMLVGAGGHFCPIARLTGSHDRESPVVAQELEFEMDAQQASSCAIREEFPELYFCRDLAGYGWCFRKGNYLNIGLGRLGRQGLPEHVSRFVKFLRAEEKIGFDPPRRMSGHAYLLFGHSPRKTFDDRLLLIGDSAGLAYPMSGEGIRTAVESGLMAAQAIRSAKGEYTRQRLESYGAQLQRYANGGQSVAARLPRSLRNAAGRGLLTTKWFCRRVVENWFLHMNEPGIHPAVNP
jgi:menaquinone-9 beta-reductase